MLKTIVYVDGFNLYYSLKKHNAKWLDIEALCKKLLTKNDVVSIKYFTAKVSNRVGDLNVHIRQNTYLRALKTNPKIEIIYGHFLNSSVWMVPVSEEGKAKPQRIRVIKTEEKGSDVNIASHLLVDGFQNKYEVAAVITNDSDLKLPIDLVRTTLNKKIGIICPQENPSKELQKVATFFKVIKPQTYLDCQFPEKIQDANGTTTKPRAWKDIKS